MLRASSEMAVAISVASLTVKPVCSATARPCCRAVTTSLSDAIRIWVSAAKGNTAPSVHAARFLLQVRQAFLQIERGTQLEEIGIRQGRLDGRDEDAALLENRYLHPGFPG